MIFHDWLHHFMLTTVYSYTMKFLADTACSTWLTEYGLLDIIRISFAYWPIIWISKCNKCPFNIHSNIMKLTRIQLAQRVGIQTASLIFWLNTTSTIFPTQKSRPLPTKIRFSCSNIRLQKQTNLNHERNYSILS